MNTANSVTLKLGTDGKVSLYTSAATDLIAEHYRQRASAGLLIAEATMVAGDAAGRPRGINSEGLKRRGFDADRIAAIKRAYRTLFVAGLPLGIVLPERLALPAFMREGL